MTYPHVSRNMLERAYLREANEQANPDSPYWMYDAKAAQTALEKRIGSDDYEAWAELTWPGDTIDGKTWKEISATTNQALALSWQYDLTPAELARAVALENKAQEWGLKPTDLADYRELLGIKDEEMRQ